MGEVWPLLLFFAVAFTLAVLRFRKRLTESTVAASPRE